MARLSLKIWLGTEGSETGVRKVYVMESFLREGKSGFYGVTPMEDHDKAVIRIPQPMRRLLGQVN